MATYAEYILGLVIVMGALGVILCKKPVHSCLSFLITLIGLAGIYLQLQAPFISAMQILIYAGAILVIFMFVIVLFQDAYLVINEVRAKSRPLVLAFAALAFIITLAQLASRLTNQSFENQTLPADYGSVQALGRAIYIDFFFPFEAVGLLFLVAIIGALYIGKKVR